MIDLERAGGIQERRRHAEHLQEDRKAEQQDETPAHSWRASQDPTPWPRRLSICVMLRLFSAGDILAHDQHRAARMLDDTGRHATQEEPPDGAQALGAGDNKVGFVRVGDF